MEFIIALLIAFGITFAFQSKMCSEKYRGLRHIPFIIPLAILIFAGKIYLTDTGFAGLNIIGAAIFIYLAVSAFAGYCLAWAMYLLSKKQQGEIKNK